MVRFIPAEDLKQRFDVFGHFYSIEVKPRRVVECRSVLEIVHKNHTSEEASVLSDRRPDAIFIMMNPGSSRPLAKVRNRIHAHLMHELPISLVLTKPDTTQYQVMRVMHYLAWQHVRVLNLSDLRCSNSTEFYKQFKQLEEDASFDAHSIFSAHRTNEVYHKLTKYKAVPVIRAWGVSRELNPLIRRCTSSIGRNKRLMGLLKDGTTDKYLHALPSLQTQKTVWVNRIVDQCQE